MINAEEFVLELNDTGESKNFKLGTVYALFVNNTAQIQFDGEDAPSEKQYAYLASYTPKVFDRVLLAITGGTYVILGKIHYNVPPATGEELDRYLFDQKLVTMTKGLSVTGVTALKSGATITGNLGVSGDITVAGITATGNVSGANMSTSGNHSTGGTIQHTGTMLGFFGATPVDKHPLIKLSTTNPTALGAYNAINNIVGVLQEYGLL